VCGSDGKEYDECTIKCHKQEGVTKECDGTCPCKDQECPDSEPEANSDCDFNPEMKCTYQEYCCCGKCQPTKTATCGHGKWRIFASQIVCNCKEECLKKCKKGYYPKVCGSDGKDYDECTIKCQEGPRKHLVTKKCDGSCPCDGEGKCECKCINPWKNYDKYKHIGDTEDTCVTKGYCYVDCSCNKHCPDKKRDKYDRCYSKTACPPWVVDPGECVKKCSKGYYPTKVCGSDGKEYDECTIKCHKQEGVTKECDGTCPCKEPECPYKRPKPFSSCSLKPEKECTYGEYCCCGECQPTDTAICLDGKWAIATASIHCNCQEECVKKCSKGEYPKVCGTDGKEYNKCTIKCHDFEGVSEECDRPCPCDKGDCLKECKGNGYQPKVCGTDGNTYNKCTIKCHEGVNRNCDGKCPCTPECLEQCKGKGYKSKVCGTDGKEYDECTIECHDGVKKDCPGTCPCIENCLEKCNGNEPKVCGSDGNEYDECSIKCYPTVTRDCGGTCPCKEVCLKKCTGNEPKVCGTDGKEYDKCSIKCETEVTEKCDGPCPCIGPCLKKCSGYDLPVCGTDGKDYDECTIKCHHGVGKNCDGKCPCKEDCLKECKGNEPKVCGTDGNEYDECSIKCYHNHGVTKKCNGTCPCKVDCLKDCKGQGYKSKVCGSDGIEYDECTIKCQKIDGVTERCPGTCPCKVDCLKKCKGTEAKVCGTDGKEYNECSIECEKEVTEECDGPCPCEKVCLKECKGNEPKVCGTDDKEYDKCSIKCKHGVTEKCDGPCPCTAPCLKKCSGYELPVCGTDGKDYDECTIKCHHGVTRECKGKCPCKKECLKECKGDEAKVCGKDGKEYTECTIKCYREVTKKCDEPCPCTEECLDKCTGYEPKVCGTDGKEYDECTIKCQKNKGVKKECDGPCPCIDNKCRPEGPMVAEDVLGCGGGVQMKCSGGCLKILKILYSCKRIEESNPAQLEIVKNLCEDKEECSVQASRKLFGDDECPGAEDSEMKLWVTYRCDGGEDGTKLTGPKTCTEGGDASCTVDGKTYKHGDYVPKGDGCNYCVCRNGKSRECTELDCTKGPKCPSKVPRPGGSCKLADKRLCPYNEHCCCGSCINTTFARCDKGRWSIAQARPLPCDQWEACEEDVCNLPKAVPCYKNRLTKWTYDKERNKCLPYFGCEEGKGNRFDSRKECEKKCLTSTPYPVNPYPTPNTEDPYQPPYDPYPTPNPHDPYQTPHDPYPHPKGPYP